MSIGAALGKYVPSYYRTVFRHGSDPDFDPVAVGIGQGLTQGLALGAVIGLVLAALYWWRSGFLQRTATSQANAAASSGAPRRSIGLMLLVGGLVAVCTGVPAFGVGYVAGLLGSDINRGNRQLDIVERIIAADPGRYGALTINHGPAGKFILEGSVNTQEDYDDLHDGLVREFGEYQADSVMGGVEINGRGATDHASHLAPSADQSTPDP